MEKAALCALNRIFGFEPRIAHALIGHFGSASETFRNGAKETDRILGPYSKYKGMISGRILDESAEELHRLSGRNISFVGICEKAYPSLLKECEDAPIGLYIRSETAPEDLFSYKRSISVVGTRDISPYGKEWCRRIVLSMGAADSRPAIISGLALGADICAHAAAMEAGLPTIGVMATGPETVYPYRHRDFAERMVHTPGCGLVTDYPPGTAPLAIHFLRRNRIIAGMGESLILIESKIKGGGMMTSRLAFSYDRDVYALPGRADDICSQGCNLLIREKVAEPVTDTDTLLKNLHLNSKTKNKRMSDEELLEGIYRHVYSKDTIMEMARLLPMIRKERGIPIDDLATASGMEYGKVSGLVSILESDGLISVDLMRRCTINIRKSELFV